MRISGTAGILLLRGAPVPGASRGGAACQGLRGEGLHQLLNRCDRVLAQGQGDGLLIMSLERLYVAGGLGLRERAKGEEFAGDPEIRNHLIDEL